MPDHLHKCCEIDARIDHLMAISADLVKIDDERVNITLEHGLVDMDKGVELMLPIMREHKRLIGHLREVLDA